MAADRQDGAGDSSISPNHRSSTLSGGSGEGRGIGFWMLQFAHRGPRFQVGVMQFVVLHGIFKILVTDFLDHTRQRQFDFLNRNDGPKQIVTIGRASYLDLGAKDTLDVTASPRTNEQRTGGTILFNNRKKRVVEA